MTETAVGEVPPAALASPGAGPWTLAWRRLLRNKIALVALGVFVLIVLVCLAAPIYAHDIAHTDPFRSNLNGTTIVNEGTQTGALPGKVLRSGRDTYTVPIPADL